RLTAPRSLPAQCGSRESSPENHCVLQTRCSHPADSAPDLRSCTSALLQPRCTDPARTALPSAPHGSDILALLPPRRCTSLPLLPPALAFSLHLKCRSARLQSAARWGPILKSYL